MLALRADPDASRAARRFMQSVLTAWDRDDVKDDATLLLSELVANAVEHARTALVVRVRRSPESVRVEVQDFSTELPHYRLAGNQSAQGRGLHILDDLTTRWGVSLAEDGKTVWVEL